MARKKGKSEGDYRVSASSFLKATVTEAETKNGHGNSLIGRQGERVIIGIPLDAFMQQFMYSSTVYPLGRMEMLIGEPDSCKTAFLFEKGRWFLSVDGSGFVYLLNEARDPADLRTSIIGADKLQPDGGFTLEGPCESLEYWQRKTTGYLHKFENHFDSAGDATWPFMIGLDSLTGTTNERAIESIDKEGCAQLTFGQDANLLNQYAKYLFQRLHKWPISFVCTNHIKFGTDRHNNKIMRIPGGDEPRYASTYIVQLAEKGKLDRLDIAGGRRILITVRKTMGDRREFGIDFTWSHAPDTGVQHSQWEWHGAAVEFFASFSGKRKERLEEIIDFPNYDKTRRYASCPALGFKKSAPIQEVGAALMDSANVQLLSTLQDFFGIRRRLAFRPGVSYRQQRDDALAAGEVEKHVHADIQTEGDEPKVAIDGDEADDAPDEVQP